LSKIKKQKTHKNKSKHKSHKTHEKAITKQSKEVEEELDKEEIEEEEEMIFNETKEKQNSSLSFKFCGFMKDNNNKPLYGVQFNPYLPKGHNYFGTVGSNKVTVYQCLEDGTNRLVQCYSDPNENEDFYSIVWSFDQISGNPLIISAGFLGIIRVIDCGQLECVRHMTGHGSAVNELKISHYNSNLLLSSSKDYSMRLWNIKTCCCVAKFGGDSGHRDQVISADFHMLSNKYIISAGMDHSIKIWSIDKKNINNAIIESDNHKANDPFSIQCEPFPCFTTRDVHNNYVDCVQWFGNFVLSKSLDNKIICWKPKQLESECRLANSKTNQINNEISFIDAFTYEDCEMWFIKFSMDPKQNLLSVGNSKGVTYVWDTDVDDPFDVKPAQLIHPKCQTIVRQTCFNNDSTILICVCEDSTIWRWAFNH
jgi:polycomb protein EED